jgi:hypothetical protein
VRSLVELDVFADPTSRMEGTKERRERNQKKRQKGCRRNKTVIPSTRYIAWMAYGSRCPWFEFND